MFEKKVARAKALQPQVFNFSKTFCICCVHPTQLCGGVSVHGEVSVQSKLPHGIEAPASLGANSNIRSLVAHELPRASGKMFVYTEGWVRVDMYLSSQDKYNFAALSGLQRMTKSLPVP